MDKSDKLDNLLKSNKSSSDSGNLTSRKYNNTKKNIEDICKQLSISTEKYKPEITVKRIEKYLELKDKMERVLYSEITCYIYTLGYVERGTLSSNVESLFIYALNNPKSDISDSCSKMIVKIYDHCQLALLQIESTKDILGSGVEESKIDLQREIKSVEKEYITILGIFAAIVLAFVGGITFSTSVLNNIANASIYRTLLVSLVIGLVLVNVLFGLFYYINSIVKTKSNISPLIISNVVIILMIALILCFWYDGKVEFRNQKISNEISQQAGDNESINEKINME